MTAQIRRFLLLAPLLLAGCATNQLLADSDEAATVAETVADLYIVDCLLPGQVRVVGGRTYLTPRRPGRMPAKECRTRGGEYTAYDRANMQTALRVWMDEAKKGDADAQNKVGEIYERGLGDEPNYEVAKFWYEKAAAQGNSDAQLSLGTLYELGLGVPKDKLQALNYYRMSWGLKEDDIIFQSAADKEIETLRKEYEDGIAGFESQIRLLQRQINTWQEQESLSGAEAQELNDLREWVTSLQGQRETQQLSLSNLRTPSASAAPDPTFAYLDERWYGKKSIGRYYALIIGNQDYEQMESLRSPVSDATKVAKILEEKYGFTVQLVTNANDATVLQAISNLNSVIGENDNLLIYYAGHGTRTGTGELERGYWLPVNAYKPPQSVFWIPTEEITAQMGNSKAKRVLVVADSCYSGILAEDPGARFLLSGDERVFVSDAFIDLRLEKKSRLMISSGGDRPVLDDSGDGNSVFANAFLTELEKNDTIITTPALFLRIREQVNSAAERLRFDQEPELKVLKGAGQAAGDFFFIPKTS